MECPHRGSTCESSRVVEEEPLIGIVDWKAASGRLEKHQRMPEDCFRNWRFRSDPPTSHLQCSFPIHTPRAIHRWRSSRYRNFCLPRKLPTVRPLPLLLSAIQKTLTRSH